MANNFGWDTIINGFSGFEALAHEYVEINFPTPSGYKWEHTKRTRDGNRDSQAVIIGFRPNNLYGEQWWMEAKYSTKRKNLPRYRLDATVVSAILDGNVTKVIFVTNIIMPSKVIRDIKTALLSATSCTDVFFVTKYTLEYWLYKNPHISTNYFKPEIIETWKCAETFLFDTAECYSSTKKNLYFTEPLKVLSTGNNYLYCFSIFSSKKQKLLIKINEKYSGIQVLSPKFISLEYGDNPCIIEFRITQGFSEAISSIYDHIFKVGSIDIMLKNHVDIIPGTIIKLNLPTQLNIKQNILKSFDNFTRLRQCKLYAIWGAGAVGKSYLLNDLLDNNLFKKCDLYFTEFTGNALENNRLLYEIILFILFPYLDPQEITIDYLDELKAHIHPEEIIYQLIDAKKDPERIAKIINSANDDCVIFNPNIIINNRYLFVDDVHKLSDEASNFLLKLLQEIQRKQLPVVVLLCGRPEYTRTSAYEKFLEKGVIEEYYLRLEAKELLECISQNIKPLNRLNADIFKNMFPDLIEFLIFTKHFSLIKTEITTINDFILACKLFSNSYEAHNAIISSFNHTFDANPKVKKLCNAIYWSVNGISLSDENYEELSSALYPLLSNNLIRYGNKGDVLPYHDKYTEIYRAHFKKENVIIQHAHQSEYESLRDTLYFGENTMDYSTVFRKIEDLFHDKQFFSLNYILEDNFKDDNLHVLKNKLGEEDFYKLYVIYAHAITNQSRHLNGKVIFKKIAEEISSSRNPVIMKICAETIFEIINSSFEWLAFDDAEYYIGKLNEQISKMKTYKIIPTDIYNYKVKILASSIELLIACELQSHDSHTLFTDLIDKCDEYGYQYEKFFFTLRYAETMYFYNTEGAKPFVKNSMDDLEKFYGKEEKFYLWAKMDYDFLLLLLDEDTTIIDVIQDREALKKDFFNDYRKRTFCIAQYFYAQKDITAGDQYLFEESSISRELRPRQLGFYHETLAVRELLTGNHKEALINLKEAEKKFLNLDSYTGLIRHNMNVIETSYDNEVKIKYSINGQLEKGVYMLDPRCIW